VSKIHALFALFLAFRVCCCLQLSEGGQRVRANLVRNGDFETPSLTAPDRPAYWSPERFYGGDPKDVHWDSKGGRENSACALIAGRGRLGLKSAPFRVEPLRRYLVSFWVHVKGSADYDPEDPRRRLRDFCGDFAFKTFSARGAADVMGQRNVIRLVVTASTKGWQRYTHVVRTGPAAVYAVLYLRFYGYAGKIWIDDVSVAPAPPIPGEIAFEQAADFLTVKPNREQGYREEVVVTGDGVALAATRNLAPNSSFEADADADGVPDGWSVRRSDEKRGVTLDTGRTRTGKRSLKLSAADYGMTEVISDPIDLEVPYPYTLSVCYHGGFDRRTHGCAQVRLIGGDGQDERIRDLFRIVKPYDWLRADLTLPPTWWWGPKKTVRISLRLYGKGEVWFDGIVLRQGTDRGEVSENESRARRGRIVSRVFEIGTPAAVRLSSEPAVTSPFGSIALFTRVGPTDVHNPNAWTRWRPVGPKGEAFLPVRGVPTYMQWKAELRLAQGEEPPVLKKVVVRGEGEDKALDYVEIARLQNGFIDRRPWAGGWRHLQQYTAQQILASPDYAAFAQDAMRGHYSELDKTGAIGSRIFKMMVLYNAYHGGGRKLGALEQASQGTGVGCGAVNNIVHQCLQNVGINTRRTGMGSLGMSGHSTLEAWSNELNKWIFVDGFYGGCFLSREGVPLSLAECFDLWHQDRAHEIHFTLGGSPIVQMFRPEASYLQKSQYPGPMRLRSDHCLVEFVSYKFRSGDINAPVSSQINCLRKDGFPDWRHDSSGKPGTREEVEFKINQTEMALRFTAGRADVHLEHNTFNFSHFEIAHSADGPWRKTDADLAWTLNQGTNALRARAVNAFGVAGPEARIGLYLQAQAAASRAKAPAALAKAPWRFPHRFRLPLQVSAGLYERVDEATRITLDLRKITGARIAPESLILVEEKPGPDAPQEIPMAVSGDEIVLQLTGKTGVFETRRLHLYMDEKPQDPRRGLAPPRYGFPNWVPNGDLEEPAPKPGALPAMPLTVPKELNAELVKQGAYEGKQCLRFTGPADKSFGLYGPFFKIEPNRPVKVTFASRAPSKTGVLRVYLSQHDKDKRGLPWNTTKVTAQLMLSGTGDEWQRGTAYGVAHEKAAWGRLRVDIVKTPEVYLDDIVVCRRRIPESGPIRVEAGTLERRR